MNVLPPIERLVPFPRNPELSTLTRGVYPPAASLMVATPLNATNAASIAPTNYATLRISLSRFYPWTYATSIAGLGSRAHKPGSLSCSEKIPRSWTGAMRDVDVREFLHGE